jgi:hypothetical protein
MTKAYPKSSNPSIHPSVEVQHYEEVVQPKSSREEVVLSLMVRELELVWGIVVRFYTLEKGGKVGMDREELEEGEWGV